MQHEITTSLPLLNESGALNEPGWSKKMLSIYDRSKIKASKARIKEWDYYLVGNDAFAIALTVADNSYMGLLSASLIEFKVPREKTINLMRFVTRGKTNLPSSSLEGITSASFKGSKISFTVKNGVRTLFAYIENFKDGLPLKVNLTLTEEPLESMVIATPFAEDTKAFYYNQKILCMKASGKATINGSDYLFSPINSYGLLDWGRGVWTYQNTWFWSAAHMKLNGKMFGFNLGYGFGNTSAATENILLYDGIVHKLDQVTFHIPTKDGTDNYLAPWKFSSNDGRLQLSFHPIIDRASKTDALLICSDQHQVFGKFSGTVFLDDGTLLTIQDMTGFAEKVYNRW